MTHSSGPAITRLPLKLHTDCTGIQKIAAVLRTYLATLSRYDVRTSLDAYASHIQEDPDAEILYDYILLLKSIGNYAEALVAVKTLLEHARLPLYRLVECDLLAAMGLEHQACTAYENLIREELASKNDLDTLTLIISRYRTYLKAHVVPDEAVRRFLDVVSRDVNVVSLLETARLYEDLGRCR